MLGIILSALILCALMHLLARHEADYSLPKVLLISAALSLISIVLTNGIDVFAPPFIILLTAWTLHQFCYVRWGKAVLIAIIFVASQIGLSIAFYHLTR